MGKSNIKNDYYENQQTKETSNTRVNLINSAKKQNRNESNRNGAVGESSTTKNTDLKNLFGLKEGRESSLSLKMDKKTA